MPREGVSNLIQVVREVYASLGHPERFKVYQPEGNHRFLVEYFEWMVEWFNQIPDGQGGLIQLGSMYQDLRKFSMRREIFLFLTPISNPLNPPYQGDL